MADEIKKWARDRALKLAAERGHIDLPCGAIDAFAAYIAAHEEQPVYPLIEEAKLILENFAVSHTGMQSAVRMALRRGIELGKAGEA